MHELIVYLHHLTNFNLIDELHVYELSQALLTYSFMKNSNPYLAAEPNPSCSVCEQSVQSPSEVRMHT